MSFFIGDPKYQKQPGTTKTHTQSEHSPLLVRRGGCGIKKILAQPTLAPQTGWSLTRHIPGVSDEFSWWLRPIGLARTPPSVRSKKEASRQHSSCRGHPSSRGGEYAGQKIRR